MLCSNDRSQDDNRDDELYCRQRRKSGLAKVGDDCGRDGVSVRERRKGKQVEVEGQNKVDRVYVQRASTNGRRDRGWGTCDDGLMVNVEATVLSSRAE